MMPYGLSMAGAVRIGLAKGAANTPAARRASTATILSSVLAIGLCALPVAFVPQWVASLYFNMEAADTRPVFDYVVIFLPIAAGFMFFDAGAGRLQPALTRSCRCEMAHGHHRYQLLGHRVPDCLLYGPSHQYRRDRHLVWLNGGANRGLYRPWNKALAAASASVSGLAISPSRNARP